MVGESLAIIAVILVMAVMLARRGRQGFALLCLPLLGVSLLHVTGSFLQLHSLLILFDVIGLALGFILCIILSKGFATRRGRGAYLLFSGVFMAALLLSYILHLT